VISIRAVVALRLVASAALAITAAAACSTDPQYLPTREYIEVGIPDSDITIAFTQVILPVRLESARETMERAALSQELGGLNVPFVNRDGLDISIEWTIRNLSDEEGIARIHINGGNEWFYYLPINFVIDPDEDEEPPPLLGNIPMVIPASGTVSGVFREQQLREAALDVELITRAQENPFAAILQIHEGEITELTDLSLGLIVPEQAFGHLVQLDIGLQSNRHMVLEYSVRIRDYRELLHDFLVDAPAQELTAFAPVGYIPPALP
jgi:hypothetical protein